MPPFDRRQEDERRDDPYGYFALQTMIQGLAGKIEVQSGAIKAVQSDQKQLFDLLREETKQRETLQRDFQLCNQKGGFETKQANERIERAETRIETLENAPEKKEEKKNNKTALTATVAATIAAFVAVGLDVVFRLLGFL